MQHSVGGRSTIGITAGAFTVNTQRSNQVSCESRAKEGSWWDRKAQPASGSTEQLHGSCGASCSRLLLCGLFCSRRCRCNGLHPPSFCDWLPYKLAADQCIRP